jgi:16S rRNA (guanine527-N7)-methyltransferase
LPVELLPVGSCFFLLKHQSLQTNSKSTLASLLCSKRQNSVQNDKSDQCINLTRHTTPELFVKRDLLDAWHLAKLLEPDEEILDIGAGGGVPGVLVAILRPDVQVTLCDSVAKKITVLTRVIDHLKLKIPVYPLSVQKVLEDFRYDTLTARAVGPLSRLCTWLQDDWHKFRRLLAIKGPRWVEERGEARHKGLMKNIELRRVAGYNMPDTESESTILQLLRPRP